MQHVFASFVIILFCERCFKFVHEKKKVGHNKEKIDPYLPFIFWCTEHQRGYLDLFCIEDEELCCPYCYLQDNLYTNHKVLKVSDDEILKRNNITLDNSSKVLMMLLKI